MNTQNLQIKVLWEKGETTEDISRGLGLNAEAVELVISGFKKAGEKAKNFKDRFGDVEQLALDTLKEVCATGENESARVMSAKILLEKKAALNSEIVFDYDEIAERLSRSRKASSLNEDEATTSEKREISPNIVAMEA